MTKKISWAVALIITILTAAGQTNNADDINRILDEYRSKGQSNETNSARLAQTTSFAVDEDYKRFRNSPCYSELGYNPNESNSDREKRYSECEREHYLSLTWKISSAVIVIGGLTFVVFTGLKRQRRQDQ
jgi:hypothetical protein